MTHEEAIKAIQREIECVKRQGKTGECCRDELGCGACDLVFEDECILEAYDMAIEALKEIGWRRRLDVSTTPKLGIVHGVDKKGDPLDLDVWCCPNCNAEIEVVKSCGKVGSFIRERCRWCGQNLDWFSAREVKKDETD